VNIRLKPFFRKLIPLVARVLREVQKGSIKVTSRSDMLLTIDHKPIPGRFDRFVEMDLRTVVIATTGWPKKTKNTKTGVDGTRTTGNCF